jgi:transposase
MVRVESEANIEILRQTAMMLEAENARLHRRLVELTRDLAKAQGTTNVQLELEIRHLQEELAARTRQLFERSSEKRSQPNGKGAEVAEAEKVALRTGHGPREQKSLPMVELVHKLDEPDRICPKCGGDLQEWEGQFEESEEIDVVERSFRLVKHRRQKYRCQCASCVETALGPQKLVAGGRYAVNFAVEVAVAKYADHMPLARQVRQMARQGLVVDSQTLWDQIFALHGHLRASYETLHAYVLRQPVIGADETTWRMMETGQSSKWWVWAVTCADAVCYRILPSRSAKAAQCVLGNYRGIVVADGYGAYGALQREIADNHNAAAFELANCMAHLRRKFVEAEPHYRVANEVLELIGKLYAIEAEARRAYPDPSQRARALIEARRTQSAPIMETIRQWLTAQGLKALPQSALGKAINYAFGLWPGLTKFLANPAIPLDNNHTEREMRAIAVGRKNHYGSRSLRGTEVAATFYSLIESAKLSALEPAAYLREAARRAIANPGTVTLPSDLLRPDTG